MLGIDMGSSAIRAKTRVAMRGATSAAAHVIERIGRMSIRDGLEQCCATPGTLIPIERDNACGTLIPIERDNACEDSTSVEWSETLLGTIPLVTTSSTVSVLVRMRKWMNTYKYQRCVVRSKGKGSIGEARGDTRGESFRICSAGDRIDSHMVAERC